jgi:hypothetical protein
MILHIDTFRRLFLFWNASVRGYFLRLLVWRVSRLGTAMDGRPMEIKDPKVISILQLLNFRLEAVRRRHDEIDPLDEMVDTLGATLAEGDEHFNPKRSTICSTRGVSDQPWTVDEISPESIEYRVEPGEEVEYSDADWYEDSIGSRSGSRDLPSPPRKGVSKEVSKVVSWLKIQLAGGRNKSSSKNSRWSPRAPPYHGRIEPFDPDQAGANYSPSPSEMEMTRSVDNESPPPPPPPPRERKGRGSAGALSRTISGTSSRYAGQLRSAHSPDPRADSPPKLDQLTLRNDDADDSTDFFGSTTVTSPSGSSQSFFKFEVRCSN